MAVHLTGVEIRALLLAIANLIEDEEDAQTRHALERAETKLRAELAVRRKAALDAAHRRRSA